MAKNTQQTVLITGSHGFVGKHLVNRLKKDSEIIFLPRELFRLPHSLYDFVTKVNPDYIYHLARYNPSQKSDEEQKMFDSNITGTFNLLEATKHLPYKGFINVGTASENDLHKTRTFYTCMKVSTSYLARAFAFEYDKPIVTVRPSFVYGVGSEETRFVDSLTLALLTNKNFSYSPKSVNDWIYVTDVVEGMVTVAKHTGMLKGEFVNISSNSHYASEDIVKALVTISGNNGKNLLPIRPLGATETNNNGDVDNSVLISLGWKKRVEIHEGLRLVFNYYKIGQGQMTLEVAQKDARAHKWCEDASKNKQQNGII